MLDKLTLENRDRRKLEIQGRIRNLEERIQRVQSLNYAEVPLSEAAREEQESIHLH